jgi:hypothetical protein
MNTVRSSIFWDITLCSLLKVKVASWLLAWLILGSWRWRQHVCPKCQLTFNGLHGIISQKTKLFITTTVRTSDPTWTLCLQNPTTRPHPKPLQFITYDHLNTDVPFISKSPKWPSFKASHHNFVWISCLVYACYMSYPAYFLDSTTIQILGAGKKLWCCSLFNYLAASCL